MSDFDFGKYIKIAEAQEKIYQIDLPIALSGANPVLSKENLDYHYNTLHKNYVKKAMDGEGHFQEAGAFLHNIFFEQFQTPKKPNNPTDATKDIIDKKFGSFASFKKEFSDKAKTIQGAGWCYLSRGGAIKIIKNHDIVSDIAVLIDMWEHSYYTDYGPDKDTYLNNVWQIIDWSVVNNRLE